jgi:hypothetical protein
LSHYYNLFLQTHKDIFHDILVKEYEKETKQQQKKNTITMDFTVIYFYFSFLSIGTFSLLWTHRHRLEESSRDFIEEEEDMDNSPFTDISSHDSRDSLETLISIINHPKPNECSKRVKTPIAFKNKWQEEEEKWRERQKEERIQKEKNRKRELQKIWNTSYS